MRIQKVMQEKGADGCLLSNGINLFYTTGRMYNGYFYLPTEGKPYFFIKRPNGIEGEHVIYLRQPQKSFSSKQTNCLILTISAYKIYSNRKNV